MRDVVKPSEEGHSQPGQPPRRKDLQKLWPCVSWVTRGHASITNETRARVRPGDVLIIVSEANPATDGASGVPFYPNFFNGV